MFLQGLGEPRDAYDSVSVDGSLFSETLYRSEVQGTSKIPCPLLHPMYYILLCALMCVSLVSQIASTAILDVFRFAFSDFKLEIFSGHNRKMLLILFLIIICSHVSVNQESGKEN